MSNGTTGELVISGFDATDTVKSMCINNNANMYSLQLSIKTVGQLKICGNRKKSKR